MTNEIASIYKPEDELCADEVVSLFSMSKIKTLHLGLGFKFHHRFSLRSSNPVLEHP